MHPLFEELVEIQRRSEERTWIAEEQLASSIDSRPHILARLGTQLVILGSWLLYHFGSLNLTPPRNTG